MNLHRSPKLVAAEFFRLAPLLSSGLRVVSERCDQDDEAALRGLVTFADGDADFARAVRGLRHSHRHIGGGGGGEDGDGDENGNRLVEKERKTADTTADALVEMYRERFNLTRSMTTAITEQRAFLLRRRGRRSNSSSSSVSCDGEDKLKRRSAGGMREMP